MFLSLDEMDKKGDFTHMLKRWQDEVLSLFELVFRQKKLHQAKREKKSWHSIIELHRTSNLGENALKCA